MAWGFAGVAVAFVAAVGAVFPCSFALAGAESFVDCHAAPGTKVFVLVDGVLAACLFDGAGGTDFACLVGVSDGFSEE